MILQTCVSPCQVTLVKGSFKVLDSKAEVESEDKGKNQHKIYLKGLGRWEENATFHLQLLIRY